MVSKFHIPVVVGIVRMIDCVLVSARDHARGTPKTPYITLIDVLTIEFYLLIN